jgi:hypothetical protein
MSHTNYRGGFGCLSFLSLFAGCANDTVNLGGGRIAQEVRSGSLCGDSSVVHGSVHVHRQSELEELAGCEEVDGDLHVEIFAGADLSPLSSLRVVDGLLEIGAYPEFPNQDVDTGELIALRQRVDAIVAGGYLASLAGLENLARVGSLDIYAITADNLEPLLGLREFNGRADTLPAGFLGVHDTPNLRDLHGLSNIINIAQLVLSNNLGLSSLGGITLGAGVVNLQVINSPLITSLPELAPVVSAYSLSLENLGIANLDELTGLNFVEYSVSLSKNRNLVNIDGLANVSAGELLVTENAVLQSIPTLPNMSWLETLMVIDNPELETLRLDLPEHGSGTNYVQGAPLTDAIEVLDIGRNSKLTRISLAAGVTEGRALAIYQNPALIRVELGTLTRLEKFSLGGNDQLATVNLGALRTVESISVVNNPNLDTTELAAVQTFETVLSGNAKEE